MTNGEILEKLFPGFEEIQVFSEYILRNGKETVMKVDREFWESEMREATGGEREGVEQYIDSIEEPCADAISRQAVLDINENHHGQMPNHINHQIWEEIKALPPVTPAEKVGRWIPVSERLPEDGQSVLFCDIDDDIMIGYHVKGRPNTHFSQDGTYEDMKNVRAWMPLPPKPYDPQESEDKE